LSAALGGAISGRPLAIRFIDRRQKLRQALSKIQFAGASEITPHVWVHPDEER
jgi:hypothetical protein